VRTALFVDFDNMYLNLKGIDPAAGEAFATEPDRWLRWMRKDMGHVVPDASEETSREILIRACYLNPVSFGRFRPYFTQSAFRVIDCPSLTSRGKNSADIYMVLDIVDTLAHSTYFDEFVLLSADADFTPVMLRLRAHDRRTVLLASGPSATALQSACDMVLPVDVFLNEALGISLHQASPQARPVAPVPDDSRSPLPDHAGRERLQQAMRDELLSVVAAAEAPVPMGAAAQRIRAHLGSDVLTSGWGGSGSFRKFVESMTGDSLQISGHTRLDTCSIRVSTIHSRPRSPVSHCQTAWLASHTGSAGSSASRNSPPTPTGSFSRNSPGYPQTTRSASR
jgi:hypothetical protein